MGGSSLTPRGRSNTTATSASQHSNEPEFLQNGQKGEESDVQEILSTPVGGTDVPKVRPSSFLSFWYLISTVNNID